MKKILVIGFCVFAPLFFITPLSAQTSLNQTIETFVTQVSQDNWAAALDLDLTLRPEDRIHFLKKVTQDNDVFVIQDWFYVFFDQTKTSGGIYIQGDIQRPAAEKNVGEAILQTFSTGFILPCAFKQVNKEWNIISPEANRSFFQGDQLSASEQEGAELFGEQYQAVRKDFTLLKADLQGSVLVAKGKISTSPFPTTSAKRIPSADVVETDVITLPPINTPSVVVEPLAEEKDNTPVFLIGLSVLALVTIIFLIKIIRRRGLRG